MARTNSARRGSQQNMRAARAAQYYTDGNTVRKIEPQYAPSERGAREAERRRAEARYARRRQQALSMDLPYLFMLTAAVVATLYICFSYLHLKSSIDTHMNSIEMLETRLENLRTENDALAQSIDTSVDLNYVYSVAVNELGMIHAGKDNVIHYDKTESEYVRQYENIPKN